MNKILKYIFLLLIIPINLYSGSIKISWDKNTEPDLAGYKVYIGESTGNYFLTTDVGLLNEHIVSDLSLGKTYFFVITAYDSAGNESGYSSEVYHTASYVEIDTVRNLKTTILDYKIILTWDALKQDELFGYIVGYGTDSDSLNKINVGNALQFITPDLEPMRLYYFVVVGVDSFGNTGKYSDIKIVTIPFKDKISPLAPINLKIEIIK